MPLEYIFKAYLPWRQAKSHEICKIPVCFQILSFSSFSLDYSLYTEIIQQENAFLRIKQSLISFCYMNNLFLHMQVVFPSLNKFNSWQNWERKRVSYNSGIFRKKTNNRKTLSLKYLKTYRYEDLSVAVRNSDYRLKEFEFSPKFTNTPQMLMMLIHKSTGTKETLEGSVPRGL